MNPSLETNIRGLQRSQSNLLQMQGHQIPFILLIGLGLHLLRPHTHWYILCNIVVFVIARCRISFLQQVPIRDVPVWSSISMILLPLAYTRKDGGDGVDALIDGAVFARNLVGTVLVLFAIRASEFVGVWWDKQEQEQEQEREREREPVGGTDG